MDSSLSLSALIRSILTEPQFVSPDEVADEAVRRTPAEQVREFYREAVREKARIQMHGIPTSTEELIVAVDEKLRSSRKRMAIADMHHRQLAARVCVDGSWKQFGECTYDDVLFLAADRQALAEANAASAERFRRVAKELVNTSAPTVSDLPADVLAAALGGES